MEDAVTRWLRLGSSCCFRAAKLGSSLPRSRFHRGDNFLSHTLGPQFSVRRLHAEHRDQPVRRHERLSDGRYVAYRGSFTGNTPAMYEIDPATGATSLLVESISAAGRVVALTPLRDGNLFGYDNNLGFLSINPMTLAYATLRITASNTPGSISTGAMATSPGADIYAWCSGRNVAEEIFSTSTRWPGPRR